MNVLFAGSATVSITALKAISESKRHQVIGVITQPDRKKGRGLLECAPPVKTAAHALGLKLFQPESINSPEFIGTLKGLKPDVMVVYAYGQKLAQAVLDLPAYGCINIHPSLLPKYRGAAPVNHAILNGDRETGVTIFRMTAKMDAGPIIKQATTPIGDEQTALELGGHLAELGAQLLGSALDDIGQGKAISLAQEERQATLAPKLKKSDGIIDWSRPAVQIYNRFRAMQPWPGVHTRFGKTDIEITRMRDARYPHGRPLGSEIRDNQYGQIVDITDNGIIVQADKGSALIMRLKPAGKKEMSAREFVNGYRLKIGDKLG
jgi:methionyl-tRNA formyltransferase